MVTAGPYNHSGYSNEEYDALIEQTKTVNATNPEERRKDMLAAEEILMEDAAVAPLYQKTTAVLEKPYVQDLYDYQGMQYNFVDTYIAEH